MAAFLVLLSLGTACVESRGDRILARDLVRAVPELSALPGDAALGPAPRPGFERIVRPAEIRSFASRWSVPVDMAESICVTGRLRTIDAREAQAALLAPFAAVAGDAAIDVIAVSSRPVPDGELVFPPFGWIVEGKDRLRWRGHVISSSGAKYPVWAVVRADTAKIARPVRRMAPRDVKAGDDVRVVVTMGAARLSLDALAETSGRAGDRITLKNRESGRRFAAIVAGPGEARIGAFNDRKN
jgi:hypothetical protein